MSLVSEPILGYSWGGTPPRNGLERAVIILGVVLLILGLIFDVGILWTIGIILIVVGALLFLLGAAGRPLGGRRHWW
ncbi:MAG TPA: hypothetical protein VK895_04720 [Jiangellaceae bacterium]|nr:hypothetical protein [Jiangellaceae bacterium]